MNAVTGSPIVIDTSIVLRWLLPDSLSEACWRLFERSTEAGQHITAPTLLVYEVVSGLSKAVYLKNISLDEAQTSLLQFFVLGLPLADANQALSQRAFEWTRRMNRAVAYDSYYLTLAEILGGEFWTADRRLYHAAHDAQLGWVHWVEEA